MSEYVNLYRELAEELFPDKQLSDEEIVLIGIAYAKGYRDGYDSLQTITEISLKTDSYKKRKGA